MDKELEEESAQEPEEESLQKLEHQRPIAWNPSTPAYNWVGFTCDTANATIVGLRPPSVSFIGCYASGAGANIAHHIDQCYALASTTFANLHLTGLITIQPFFGGEERTPAKLSLVDAPIIFVPRTDWLWLAFLLPGAAPCRFAAASPSSVAHAASPAAAAPAELAFLHTGVRRRPLPL
nr:probable carboxylesterase 18 [Oryza sativa Japonica Group]